MRVAFLLALLAAAFLPRLSTASQLASHEMSDASEPTVRPILLLPPASYFPNLDFSTDAPLPTRFTITGRPVFLCDRSVDSEALDIPLDEHAARTGGSLWDCAVVLAKFLEWVAGGDRGEEFGALDVKGKRVVELVRRGALRDRSLGRVNWL